MENKIKRFKAYEGNQFLNYIRGKGQKTASWEYAPKCFLNYVNGLINKQEGDKIFSYITGRGWVEY